MGITDSCFMGLALAEAALYEGATAPNPPVGATIVKEGRVLSVGAHRKAGTPHAELVALEAAIQVHGKQALQGATIYVTLEPCNHHGRTGPCTQALIKAGIREVVVGATDPNPRVTGGGIQTLLAAGLQVRTGILGKQCQQLLAAFTKQVLRATPFVVHKTAWRLDEYGQPTMLPAPGQKTFTSTDSLRRAHEERRRCDAVITGLGTVLADDPQFTVRLVPDHQGGLRRQLAVVGDPSRQTASSPSTETLWRSWLQRQSALGFEVLAAPTLKEALQELGRRGAQRALLEAGPKLSFVAESEELWDKRLTFLVRPDMPDLVIEEWATPYS